MIRRAFLGSLCVAGISARSVLAADREAGLYDPEPPPGSAFLRVFNASNVSQKARIGGKALPIIPAFSVSNYVIIKAGNVQIQWASGPTTSVPIQEGAFGTCVRLSNANGPSFIDQARPGPLKVGIVLYNISPLPLSLKTLDGKQSVLELVGSQRSAARLVNPVTTGLLIEGQQGRVTLAPTALQRSSVYGVFAWRGLRGLQAKMVRAKTDTL